MKKIVAAITVILAYLFVGAIEASASQCSPNTYYSGCTPEQLRAIQSGQFNSRQPKTGGVVSSSSYKVPYQGGAAALAKQNAERDARIAERASIKMARKQARKNNGYMIQRSDGTWTTITKP